MKKLNVGVLGVSNHFIKRIILPMKAAQLCHVYAIASRSVSKAEKMAETYGIDKCYNDYEALIADKEVEAVYIPLPNHMHAQWIKKCADYGKPVLCEKPIALNAAEAKDAMEYCEQKQVPLMEGFMYKFHPLWKHAKNIIQTNQIGSIQYINSMFSYNNPNENNIRNIKEFGGGALYDIGCYAVSTPRFLLNKEPIKVVALVKEHETFKTDIINSAIIDFGDVNATYTVATLAEANQRVEIVGSAGRIVIPIPYNIYVDTTAEMHVYTAQGKRTLTFETCDQYGLMFDAFAQSIINNHEVPVHPKDAINNMKVLDALFASAENGCWVDLEV